MFVPSPGVKSSHASFLKTFHRLASPALKAAVARYVAWANATAREELIPNLQGIEASEASGYTFGNHSFIVSYEMNSRAQVGHIDLKHGSALVQCDGQDPSDASG